MAKNGKKQYKLKPDEDLAGSTTPTELGEIAGDFVHCKEETDKHKAEMERIKPLLIAAFHKENRESITIRGRTVTIADICKITVKKPD